MKDSAEMYLMLPHPLNKNKAGKHLHHPVSNNFHSTKIAVFFKICRPGNSDWLQYTKKNKQTKNPTQKPRHS